MSKTANIKNNYRNNQCSGCGVCAAVCPGNAITMNKSEEGFLSSELNASLCIQCGLCSRVCPHLQAPLFHYPDKTYVARAMDETRYKNSSSAGVCSSLAEYMLEQEHYVCGARYNNNSNTVEHFIARDNVACQEAQGSKYLQSNAVAAFKEILRQAAKKQKYIVFGTPCQIAGLRNYARIKKIEDNLLLVDFFCHGVPSYLLWENYLMHYGVGKPEQVLFRRKTDRRWNDFCMSIQENGKTSEHFSSENDLFHRLFIFDVCLCRTCTRTCHYYSCNSSADVRVGDCWNRTLHKDKLPMSTVLLYREEMEECIKKAPNLVLTRVKVPDMVIGGQPLEKRKEYVQWEKVIEALKRKKNLKRIFYQHVGPRLVKNKIHKIVKVQ